MNEEVRTTSDESEPAAEEAGKIRMSMADALSILANLARKRDTTLEEVVAIQIAVRNVAKRMFDRERCLRRKYGAKEETGIANDEGRTTNDEGEEAAHETKSVSYAVWRGRRSSLDSIGIALDVYRSCPDGVEFARSDVLPAFLKTPSGMSGEVSKRRLSSYLKALASAGALRNWGNSSPASRYFKRSVGESALMRMLEKNGPLFSRKEGAE